MTAAKRALEMVLDRQHVARELARGISRRLLLLLLEAAAHVLDLGRGIERLRIRLLELRFELGDAVVLGKLGRAVGGFLAQLLGFVVQLFVFGHAINLVSALAVKSTMGTTRA